MNRKSLHPEHLTWRGSYSDMERESLSDKQQPRQVVATELHKRPEGFGQQDRKGQSEQKEVRGKKLTGKGQHLVELVDQPTVRLVGRLQDKSRKTTGE